MLHWSLCVQPRFVATLCYEGFLPMCTEVRQAKLHITATVAPPRMTLWRVTVGRQRTALLGSTVGRSVGSCGWPNADGLLPLVRAAPRRCTQRKCERLALHSQVAAALYVLLPKLHEKRCVLYFDKLHEPKQAKKKTKHYRLSSNRAFHEVMQVRPIPPQEYPRALCSAVQHLSER